MGIRINNTTAKAIKEIADASGVPYVTVHTNIKAYHEFLIDAAVKSGGFSMTGITSVKVYKDEETGEYFTRGRVSKSLAERINEGKVNFQEKATKTLVKSVRAKEVVEEQEYREPSISELASMSEVVTIQGTKEEYIQEDMGYMDEVIEDDLEDIEEVSEFDDIPLDIEVIESIPPVEDIIDSVVESETIEIPEPTIIENTGGLTIG